MKLVQIDWIDSTSSGRWEPDEDGGKHRLPRIRTVGYLLHRDKERMVLTQSVDSELKSNCDRIVIPMGCIKKLRYLKER